jgi:hypothetical protein
MFPVKPEEPTPSDLPGWPIWAFIGLMVLVGVIATAMRG